jgi:DnaJ homolog subfamily C member 19
VIWLLLLAGAVAAWGWKTGRFPPVRIGDAAAVAAALIALRMLAQGKPLPGLVAAAGVAVWLYARRSRSAPAMDAAEARALLELGPDADRTAILSAHRRLIARVHPDAGGSAELARRVNSARDTLLDQLRR